MIKFIHTSDWHLGRRSYNSEELYKDNFRVIIKLIQSIKKMEEQEKPDFILHAGDIFDSHKVDSRTFNFAIDIFSQFKDLKIPVYVIRGNHDANEESYRDTFLHALDRVGLIKVISTSLDANQKVFEPVKGVRLYGVGHKYVYYRERVKQIINAHPLNPSDINILCLHASVVGLEGSENRASTPGKDVFSANALLDFGFNYIALGHHHICSILQPKKNGPAIAYSGATEHWNRSNWNDSFNNTKAALDVKIDKDTVEIVELELKVRPKIYLERKFHEINPEDAKDKILALIAEKDKEFKSFIPEGIEEEDERQKSLPLIYFYFTIGFLEEELNYPFDRIKLKLRNILQEGSSIRIESIVENEEIEFTDEHNEEELYLQIIEKLYPDSRDKFFEVLTHSIGKHESLFESTDNVKKTEDELAEYLWKTYMEED